MEEPFKSTYGKVKFKSWLIDADFSVRACIEVPKHVSVDII